jgi:DNA-binding PadR family transcriptional regulator
MESAFAKEICVWTYFSWPIAVIKRDSLFSGHSVKSGIVMRDTLGQFEQLVLAAICKVNNAYAVPILAEVERLYGRPVRISSIYITLERLEAKAYVHWRAPEAPLQSNKPKGYYSVAPAGKEALRDAVKTAERFLETLRPTNTRGKNTVAPVPVQTISPDLL